MFHFIKNCLAITAILVVGCSEDKNAVNNSASEDESFVAFTSGTCKKEAAKVEPFESYGLYTVANEDKAKFDGLQCVSWKQGDVLSVDLINFHESCGISIAGGSQLQEDGTLHLYAHNQSCDVASCGWCTYDWSFEVNLEATEQDLFLAISSDPYPADICPEVHSSNSMKQYSLMIPKEERLSGLACRPQYYHALMDYAMSTGTEGHRMFPCNGAENNGTTAVACNEGLECVSTDVRGYTEHLCMETCVENADCSYPDLFSCTGGICTLSNLWVSD